MSIPRGRRWRWLATIAPLSLMVACGGGSSSSPDGGEAAAVVTTDPAGTASAAGTASTVGTTSPAVTALVPSRGSNAPPVTFDTGTGSTSPAIVNSTTAGVSGERPDSLPVREESLDSPLPEVVVRHLQSATFVQLKDLLPADKPLLVWFWAPH